MCDGFYELAAAVWLLTVELRGRAQRRSARRRTTPDAPSSGGSGGPSLPQPRSEGDLLVATRAETAPAVAPKGWTPAATTAAMAFASMAVFLVMVALGGYLAAVLVFVPVFLLLVARTSTRTAVVYTLVLGAVLLALPTVLPVDLPMGMLQ